MSGAQSPDLLGLIGDMEEDVRDLVSWATAITTVGCHHGSLQPAEVWVMGQAMLAVAKRVQSDWRDLHHFAAAAAPGRVGR